MMEPLPHAYSTLQLSLTGTTREARSHVGFKVGDEREYRHLVAPTPLNMRLSDDYGQVRGCP